MKMIGADLRCSDCREPWGAQHKPSCHRQGTVTAASDYRDKPTVETMIDELTAAGWEAKTTTIWRAPGGALFVGPAGAWKMMKQREGKA